LNLFKLILDWLADLALTTSQEQRLRAVSPDAQLLPGTEVQMELGSGYSVEVEEAGKRGHIVAYCRAQLGLPYRLGEEVEPGEDPDAWDCSELTEGAYRAIGMPLPDGARYQFEDTQAVPRPLPGDLGFLWSDARGMIGHVMVATGEGTVVHAVGGRGVVEDPQDRWERHPRWKGWRRHVGFARAPHERIS
jgi:cell wall-associated NlpC family hydrolase